MTKKKIGQLLVEGGYITLEQLAKALETQKGRHERICNILMDLGYLSEGDFLEFLGTIPGTASIILSGCELEKRVLDLVPRELARRLELVPIGKIGKVLTVGMVCPLDGAAREELEETTGLRVRPVLCSRSAVFETLDRYYKAHEAEKSPDLSALEGPLKLRRVAKFVEEIEELPTLPDIVSKVSSIVNDPNSSAADLAEVISTDTSLSAKILKIANSPAYGFSRKILDIHRAVALLGFKETQALAISVSAFEQLIDKAEFDFRAYWKHSFSCAVLTKLISLNLKSPGTEAAFVAGLLHDIGKAVLAMKMPGKQERVASLHSTSGIEGPEAEQQALGIAHAEAGYLLAEHWLLPPVLTDAIRYHHSPEMEPGPEELASAVFLANIFCKMDTTQLTENKGLEQKVLEVLKDIGLSEVALNKTLATYANMAPRVIVL